MKIKLKKKLIIKNSDPIREYYILINRQIKTLPILITIFSGVL